MTMGFDVGIRDGGLSAIAAAADAGPGNAILLILDGARPATGAAITGQITLATLAPSDPMFAVPVAGVLTANAITGDTNADASGGATWYRITDSTGAFVGDGDCGLVGSGADMELTATAVVIGVPVNVNSIVITAGNA